MNDYLALLLSLLIRRVRHLMRILLICLCACEVGCPSSFERENVSAIHCLNEIKVKYRILHYTCNTPILHLSEVCLLWLGAPLFGSRSLLKRCYASLQN